MSRPSSPRLRLLDAPHPVQVRTDASGEPVAVRTRRGFSGVAGLREIWRIDDEWWRRPVSRIYYAVVLESGRAMTLFHDLAEGGWYVHTSRAASPSTRPTSLRTRPRGAG